MIGWALARGARILVRILVRPNFSPCTGATRFLRSRIAAAQYQQQLAHLPDNLWLRIVRGGAGQHLRGGGCRARQCNQYI